MRELWVPVSGAIANQRKVETIANNVANANTPGFKKDGVSFKEYITALEKGHDEIDLPNKEWRPEDFYKSYGAEHAQVQVSGSYTNFEQGQLRPTNSPFDLALQGSGFFEILTPNGVRYSRQGNFNLDREGHLVTSNGNKVLSSPPTEEDGAQLNAINAPEERVIRLGPGPFSVNLQGKMFSGDRPLGQISIVEFRDPQALRKESSSLYIANDAKNRQIAEKTAVQQGFIESSNVNAVQEMTELIKAHRNFESISNAIKTYDSMSNKGVNDILKF